MPETPQPSDLDDYRSTYFADPNKPLDPAYIQAAQFLMSNLLGLPRKAVDTESSNVPLENFINELARRMQDSRHFDANSMAQLHPNGNMPAILAHFASTMRNANTIIGEVSRVETAMEEEAIRWLNREIVGFNEEKSGGAITTGGTLANLTGLMVAREKLTREKGWDGTKKAYILTTPMAHYSVKKAAAVLAPSALIEVVAVPMQKGSYRMDTTQLQRYVTELTEQNQPIMAIVGIAGETETGLVDDLTTIGEIAHSNGVYFHIDGAYGAPFALSRQGNLFVGMNTGDSVTVDPHKYLYTPYAAGSILFANRTDQQYLTDANEGGSAYMFKKDVPRPQTSSTQVEDPNAWRAHYLGDKRIEGSMGGQGAAATWATIHTLGRDGLKAILDHTLDMAGVAATYIDASPIFVAAHRPDINSLCFYPDPDAFVNQTLSDKMKTIVNGDTEYYNKLVEEARLRLEDRTGIYITTTSLPIPIEGKGYTSVTTISDVSTLNGRRQISPSNQTIEAIQSRDPEEERQKIKVFRFVTTHPYTEKQNVTQALDALSEIWKELILETIEKEDTVILPTVQAVTAKVHSRKTNPL